jgi:hypothetical protein
VAVGHKDHGRVAVAVAITFGGLDQLPDLGRLGLLLKLSAEAFRDGGICIVAWVAAPSLLLAPLVLRSNRPNRNRQHRSGQMGP